MTIYIYIGFKLIIPDETLINITSFNNFLLNSYFGNHMVKLHVLNMHVMVGLHFYMFFTHIKLLKNNFPLQINFI